MEVDGAPVRVYTSRVGPGLASQTARPLREVNSALADLRLGLGVVAVAGIALAAFLGRLATRHAVRPVTDLTDAAEHVARTRDLSRRIATSGGDELARLATSFNTMLEALDDSRRAQRQLVADASHELRTPLTSLRTNVEVLTRVADMDPVERERVLTDLGTELEELSTLVAELVDLATDQRDADFEAVTNVNVGEIANAAIDRTHRRTVRTINATVVDAPANGRPPRSSARSRTCSTTL